MKKHENFCAALKNLKEIYNYEQPYDSVVLTGLVGLFGICFEQSWKAMKEILEEQGFSESQTGSPRMIIKTAFKASMVKNETVWLEALVSRNNVTHAYNQAIALDIVNKTKKFYVDMFRQLQHEINDRWLIK